MAITTYAELQTAIINWSGRSDLTSRAPEFIALCEAKLNRELRAIAGMQTKNTTFSITGEYVAVPTDFLEVTNFYLNTTPKTPLRFMPDDAQSALFGSGSGKPKYYSIAASYFRFGPVPDGTYSATLIYFRTVPPLVSNTSNGILTNHPDIYLYGSLAEMGGWIDDDAKLQKWKAMYESAVRELIASDSASRWGGPGMAVRLG